MGDLLGDAATVPRSPLVGISVALALGIVIYAPAVWALALVVVAFSSTLALLLCCSRRSPITVLVWMGFVGLGSLAVSLPGTNGGQESLTKLYLRQGAIAPWIPWLVRGRLVSSPVSSPDLIRFDLEVERVRFARVGHPIASRVRVYVRGTHLRRCGDLGLGDRIQVWARLRPTRSSRNGASLRGARHSSARPALSASVKSALLVERVSGGRQKPALLVRRIASKLRFALTQRLAQRLGDVAVDEADIAIASALLVGDRSGLSEQTEQIYRRGGLLHVLALSGAHVAIWMGLLQALFSMIGGSLRARYVLLLVFVVMYPLVCGGQASVVRASAMAAVFILSRAMSLSSPSLNALALVAFGVLLVVPRELFDVGFQLSFLATLTILLFYPMFRDGLGFLGPLAAPLCLSLAAQLGVVPLLAFHFHEWAPVSLVTASLAMPAAAMVMISAATVCCVPEFVVWFASRGVVWGCGWLQAVLEWPGRFDLLEPVALARPGLGSILLYGLALVCLRVGWSASTPGLRCLRALGVVGPVVVLCTLGLASSSLGRLTLHMLDVGHGDAIVVGTPEGQWLLVDGGVATNGYDAGKRTVLPFLKRRGIRGLHAVVLSHPDRDHVGGLQSVVEGFPVSELWSAPSALSSDKAERLREAVDRQGVAHRVLLAGESFVFGGVQIEVLASDGHVGARHVVPNATDNDRSVVLRLGWRGRNVLLMGDAEAPLESMLASAHPQKLRADILKVSHHGSATSTGSEFLSLVQPRFALMSTRAGGSRRLPAPRIVERLHRRGAQLLRTDRDGDISVNIDSAGGLRLETSRQLSRGVYSRYFY